MGKLREVLFRLLALGDVQHEGDAATLIVISGQHQPAFQYGAPRAGLDAHLQLALFDVGSSPAVSE